LSDTTVFNPFATAFDTTLYKVTVTDIFGCVGIDSVTVNVKPTPVVTVPLNAIYCNGDAVPASNYSSVPAGANYNWSNSNTTIGLPVLFGIINTPAFTAINTTSQIIIDTISVTPYYLGCTGDPVEYTITVNPIPTLVTPPSQVYCIGDVVPASHISGTPSGLTFDWTNSNTTIGLGVNGSQDVPSFTAVNTNNLPSVGLITVTPQANGCTGNPINYNITVSSPIIIDRVITNANCFGSNDGEIRAIPSGGTPNYTYSWTNGDTDSIASSLSAGTITLTVTDVNNCTQDSTFTILEPDSIDYISFTASPREGCSPLEVMFNATIPPSQNLVKNYVWDFGNNLLPQDSFNAQTTYQNPGSYNVSLTVTDFSGCSNTLTINDYITVFEDPEAHFNSFPDNPTMFNPTVSFSDISYPNVVGWEWYFDTLGNSNYQNPDFIFPKDSGNYLVTLIVEDNNTCRDTITKNIFIRSEIALFIPNSFTPNGDGLNDNFIPKGFGISLEGYSFIIFNRWGEIVFKTNNVLDSWDGSYNGEFLPSGVYVWRADFQDLNGKDYRRTGQLNILR
jgi:gliding motility-associated-like protein